MNIRHQGTLAVLLIALFSPSLSAQVSCATVVINELHINPGAVSDSRGEWIELYNNMPYGIDIEGWTISDGKNDSFTIKGTLILPSCGYAVLARNGDSILNGGVDPDYVYGGMYLTNSADSVVLCNNSHELVDSVTYSKEWGYHIISGASLERAGPTSDPALPGSWIPSTSLFGQGDRGTPGFCNSCHIPAPVTNVNHPPYFAIMKVFSYRASQMYEKILESEGCNGPVETGFLTDVAARIGAGDILRALCLMDQYTGKTFL